MNNTIVKDILEFFFIAIFLFHHTSDCVAAITILFFKKKSIVKIYIIKSTANYCIIKYMPIKITICYPDFDWSALLGYL